MKRRTAKTEVLDEATRLGVRPAVVEALRVNLDEDDFHEELHGIPVLPDPARASKRDRPVAAAVANVRRARGAELNARRAKADLAREHRAEGVASAREAKSEKAQEAARRLREWAEKQTGITSDEQFKRRLDLGGKVGADHRKEALGSTDAKVPSADTIGRIRRGQK